MAHRRHRRARRNPKTSTYVIGGLVLAGLGVGAYYLYQQKQKSTAQLPPAGGTTPASG